MCGICGEIANRGAADVSAVQRMNAVLSPRGPDAEGVHQQGRLAFGHRRLTILDHSSASEQPMLDAALGLGIVFNGCIYNFRELRAELQAKGYKFFSSGDTEVILKAYHAWGPRCVERFCGMFAFALWERDSGRVILVRDRLGIKPLYYAQSGHALRFASSLPALLAAGDIDTGIDPVALHHYMSFHAVVPPPRTILRGVRKLPPATIMTIEPGGRRKQETYWKIAVGEGSANPNLSEDDWMDSVLTAMTKAVDRRTVADVPLGVLLSGGFDSSLIVALLAKSGHGAIETFSIGFESSRDQSGDEFQYSDLIAREFGTTHHKIDVDPDRLASALPEAVKAMAEPMVSHDAVGFYLLSELVSKKVKVALSGQGADEVFAGYHWYQPFEESTDALEDYAQLYFDRDHAEMRQALSPRMLGADYSREFVERYFGRLGAARPIDKVLQIDSQIMLPDDPVKRVDNMTMAWGLEARVPFLDHEVVEIAARIPSELKLKNGGKYILKEAARGLVPDAIIDRPKGYFPVPALKKLSGPYLELVRGWLESTTARQRGIFNPYYVEKLLDNPGGELTPKGNSKLWQVGLLEGWLQAHGI